VIAGQQQSDQIWKNYETSGTLNIQEKYIEKNQKIVKGTLDLTAKENGVIKYNLRGIEFKTGSFEN